MNIKFDTDDNLPLNKPLKLRILTIIVRPIIKEDGNSYPQIYLNKNNKKKHKKISIR